MLSRPVAAQPVAEMALRLLHTGAGRLFWSGVPWESNSNPHPTITLYL